MPRVPDNTQTRTPTLLKRSAQVPTNGLGSAGSALAASARMLDTPIRHEGDVQRKNAADANEKLRRVNAGIKGLADGAHMVNKVLDMRAQTEARRNLTDLQNFLTMNETGYERDDGTRVASVYEVPYNPGGEDGAGISGATAELSKRVKEWSESRGEVTGRTLEFYQRDAEAAIDRSMARARNVDGRRHEEYKQAVNENFFASQRKLAGESGTVEDISTAAATGALLKVPRQFVENYDEWMRDPAKDPGALRFVTPEAQKVFENAYADVTDAIASDVANRIVAQAIQSDDDEQANIVFDAVEANGFLTYNGIAGDGGGFWAQENQLKAQELVGRARAERTRRIAAEQSFLLAEGYEIGTMAALGTWRAGMSEDDKSGKKTRLREIMAKLPGDEALKLAQYQVGLAEKAELFEFEQFRLETMKDANLLNIAEKKSFLKKRASGMKSLGAREKALDMVANLSFESGDKDSVTKEKARYDLLMGGVTMKSVYDKSQAGQIDNVSFGRYWEASRELAEEAVDMANVPEACAWGLEKFGIPVVDLVPKAADGSMKFGARNEIPFPLDPFKTKKAMINGKKVELSDKARHATLRLAIEYETQRKQGLRKESFREYFLENIVNEPVWHEWTTLGYEEAINSHAEKIMAERDAWNRAGYTRTPLESFSTQRQPSPASARPSGPPTVSENGDAPSAPRPASKAQSQQEKLDSILKELL